MQKVIVGTRGTSGVPEFAGATWFPLQYVLGLQRLGIESFWVDRLYAWNPLKTRRSLDYLVHRFDATAREFGFEDRYCIIYDGGKEYFGMTERQLMSVVHEADLLLNISGYLPDDSPLMRTRRRAYIDVDPGFTQMWALEWDMGIPNHNFFFTTGQNVGRPEFKIPLSDTPWVPIVPPIALDWWPPMIEEKCERFTTVADWRGSQEARFDGEYYGGKRSEFVRFIDIPLESDQGLEIALCIGAGDHEDIRLLHRKGWHVLDSYQYTGDLYSYRDYVRFSRAEFSVAKHGYVKSNSGWISDRTACYLGSGKPVLVQSTGFEQVFPAGKGLLTFRTVEEAVAGIEAINRDYLAHCQAARELAEAYFDSDLVLGRILEHVGL